MLSLFDLITSALHTVEKILMYVGVLFFLVIGIIVMTSDIIPGLILLFVGVFGSVTSSLLLYGVGELIINTDRILAGQYRSKLPKKELEESKVD